jgi:hypothetical protein
VHRYFLLGNLLLPLALGAVDHQTAFFSGTGRHIAPDRPPLRFHLPSPFVSPIACQIPCGNRLCSPRTVVPIRISIAAMTPHRKPACK